MEEFKKINIGNIDNNIPHDLYFIDKSFDDEKRGCIHVPVKMVNTKGVTHGDHFDIIDVMMPEVIAKYNNKDFCISGGANRWDYVQNNNGESEYLFFYKVN
jgi:hypothetical protein